MATTLKRSVKGSALNASEHDANIEVIDSNKSKIDALISVDVKSHGAVGDGVTDDTIAIQAAFDALVTTGGVLSFSIGTYIVSSELFIAGSANTVTSFAIKGMGSQDETLLRANTLDNATVIKSTTTTGNVFKINSLVSGISDYSNIVKNIKISDLSFWAETSGNVVELLRVPQSRYDNITIYNGGSGTALKVFDPYISVFNRIFTTGKTSIVSGSIGLEFDAYEGSGGMVRFNDCNFQYADTAGYIGSPTGGASGYGGLQSINFINTEFHHSNQNLVIGSNTGVAEVTDHIINFFGCYLELNQTKSAIKLTNGVTVNFFGSYFSGHGTNHLFEIGGATAAEYTGISLKLDGCYVATPVTGGAVFYAYDNADTIFDIKNTSFKNNGNLSFDFENDGTFNGKILIDNIKFNNWSDSAFMSSEAKRYVTSESNRKYWATITNETLDRSSFLTIPAKIKASTYSSDSGLDLPTSLSTENGTKVTVVKASSANSFTFDAGTGNVITGLGQSAQTYAFTGYGDSISLMLNNNGVSLEWIIY